MFNLAHVSYPVNFWVERDPTRYVQVEFESAYRVKVTARIDGNMKVETKNFGEPVSPTREKALLLANQVAMNMAGATV